MGDQGQRSFDTEEISAIARELTEMARETDELGIFAPSSVDAGPFAAQLTDAVNGVFANLTDMIADVTRVTETAEACARRYDEDAYRTVMIIGGVADEIVDVFDARGEQ